MTAWETIREAPRRLGEAAHHARPQLRGIISPPRRLSPISFAVLVVAIMVGGMVGMLVLTTELQNQAFAVRDAERVASELGYRESDLETQVNRARSPESVGLLATELGMVPNPHGVFIDIRSGEVLGEPTAVRGDEIPSLKVLPAPPPEEEATDGEQVEGEGAEGAAPADDDADAGAAPADDATDAEPRAEATAHAATTPTGEQG